MDFMEERPPPGSMGGGKWTVFTMSVVQFFTYDLAPLPELARLAELKIIIIINIFNFIERREFY